MALLVVLEGVDRVVIFAAQNVAERRLLTIFRAERVLEGEQTRVTHLAKHLADLVRAESEFFAEFVLGRKSV
jgi:hypothetical protein